MSGTGPYPSESFFGKAGVRLIGDVKVFSARARSESFFGNAGVGQGFGSRHVCGGYKTLARFPGPMFIRITADDRKAGLDERFGLSAPVEPLLLFSR